MGPPGSTPNVTREDVRGLFTHQPCTPITPAEAADELECSREIAENNLVELADHGELQSKRIDSTTRVWWRPNDETATEREGGRKEFAAFVDAVEDYAIFMLDPDGIVISWNDGAERIKGYEKEEIVGEHFSTFYTEDEIAENVPERNLEIAVREERVEDEGWRVREDGSRFWANVTITAVRSDDGTLQGFTKVTRDMTERREYEQQLRRQSRQTRKLLQTAPISIAVQNTDRETVMANQRAQETFGLSEEEFTQNPVDTGEWEIYDANGNPLDPDETPSARVLETGEPIFDEELIFETPTGERMFFRVNTAPIFGSDGEIERVVTGGKDITALKEREQQLERRKTELETELSEIFGRVSDSFCALDEEWRFTHLNDQAAEFLQRSKEEMIGQEVWEVIPETTENLYREKLETAMETQEPTSFEVYEEDHDAWLEFTAYPSQSGLSIYFRDITERIEYERELTQYETIVETVNDGIYVKDKDGYFTMVNEAYTDLTGYDREELVGNHASMIVDEETIGQSRELMDTSDESVGNPTLEAEIRTATGNRIPAEGTFATIQTGKSQGEVGVVRDITERKERERALREREHRLKRYTEYTDDILNAIDDIFYLLGEDGQLRRWNRSITERTGYTDGEISSMNALEFFAENEREKIAAAISEGFETGDSQVEANVLTKEETRIPYEFVASTLEDPDGERVLAGIGRDITDRREYERKLEESNERLEQFAYAASHDLQEPLRMITSYLSLLDNRYAEDLDEDAREFIEFAVDGAERMREMIDGLLQYSRVETRGDPFEAIELDGVVSDACDDLQLQIEETNAEFDIEPLPWVRGDVSQLRHVFQNLLDNALEYSGDEPPRIYIAAERDGNDWIISVEDEGIGIDPDDTDRIFEVFQRLHSHEEYSGTGIGLALCQRIIERHGGEIWVESEPGEGSTFFFTLPAADRTRQEERDVK